MLVRFPSACMRVSEHLRSSFRGTGVAIGEGNSAEYSVSFCVMLVLDIRDCCTRHRRPGQTLHAPRPAVPVPCPTTRHDGRAHKKDGGDLDHENVRPGRQRFTKTAGALAAGARSNSATQPVFLLPPDGRIPSLAARHV
jgi:hypothetical protein